MGYQINTNAPKITYQGRTFAVDAVLNMLNCLEVSIYEQDMLGVWSTIYTAQSFGSDIVSAVKIKGGIQVMIADIIQKLITSLAKIFASTPIPTPPVGEPATQDEVVAAIQAALYAKKLVVVAGVLTLADK